MHHDDEPLTVGQVAERFGVSVRTLHHYDDIGLLSPRARSAGGYRLYDADDIERLATIVSYRRLGFALDEVAALMAGAGDRRAHLERQLRSVQGRVAELLALVAALEQALEDDMADQPLDDAGLKRLFGDSYDESYAAEAESRWGQTQAWQQSAARTKRYTKADWEGLKDEAERINAAFVAALAAGHPANSEPAMGAAEAHRAHIERWFYDLDHAFHRGLADMYVTDPRFTKTYDDLAPGLAAYVRDAIHANADRHERP